MGSSAWSWEGSAVRMTSAHLDRRKWIKKVKFSGTLDANGFVPVVCGGQSFTLPCSSPFLAVLHGSMNGVTVASKYVTFGPASQQGLDCLRASQAAGHVEGRFSCQVGFVHPSTQAATQHLKTTIRSTTVNREPQRRNSSVSMRHWLNPRVSLRDTKRRPIKDLCGMNQPIPK